MLKSRVFRSSQMHKAIYHPTEHWALFKHKFSLILKRLNHVGPIFKTTNNTFVHICWLYGIALQYFNNSVKVQVIIRI